MTLAGLKGRVKGEAGKNYKTGRGFWPGLGLLKIMARQGRGQDSVERRDGVNSMAGQG